MLAARIIATTTVIAKLAQVHLGSTAWKKYIKFVSSMATINLSVQIYDIVWRVNEGRWRGIPRRALSLSVWGDLRETGVGMANRVYLGLLKGGENRLVFSKLIKCGCVLVKYWRQYMMAF